MAKTARRGKATPKNKSIFDLDLRGWLGGANTAPKGRARTHGRLIYVGHQAAPEAALAELELALPAWLKERVTAKKRGEVVYLPAAEGPVWLILPEAKGVGNAHGGLLTTSPYGLARDLFAQVVAQLTDTGLGELEVQWFEAEREEQLGGLVGLELGAYRFRQVRQAKPGQELPQLLLPGVARDLIEQAAALGVATNLARHLVNLPAADLNPTSYADSLHALFADSASMSVAIWRGKKLVSERMGLLLGVGQGAVEGPALVHLRYRPKGSPRGQRPLAFVGKGITFDTGGLDIKVGAGMRLMKKDMGGSASLAGLAYWVERRGLPVACDFYLALAENAVDQKSYRPGDILTARSGMTVEIDNTDAEGRLVLGDALDVAVTAKGADAPAAVIDLATLTGAMRVSLGTRVAGMFANDDTLAQDLLTSSQRSSEPTWRMPLFTDYLSSLKSTVADIANSGHSRFGGAIVAALFLQRFVGQTPWAHVDMYGWTEGATGGCMEAGGSGQCVQLLADFLTGRSGK